MLSHYTYKSELREGAVQQTLDANELPIRVLFPERLDDEPSPQFPLTDTLAMAYFREDLFVSGREITHRPPIFQSEDYVVIPNVDESRDIYHVFQAHISRRPESFELQVGLVMQRVPQERIEWVMRNIELKTLDTARTFVVAHYPPAPLRPMAQSHHPRFTGIDLATPGADRVGYTEVSRTMQAMQLQGSGLISRETARQMAGYQEDLMHVQRENALSRLGMAGIPESYREQHQQDLQELQARRLRNQQNPEFQRMLRMAEQRGRTTGPSSVDPGQLMELSNRLLDARRRAAQEAPTTPEDRLTVERMLELVNNERDFSQQRTRRAAPAPAPAPVVEEAVPSLEWGRKLDLD